MLCRHFRRALGLEGERAGQHVNIHDRQTVLVALPRGPAFEQFWRGISRRQAAHQRATPFVQVLHQAEVAQLGAPADDEYVFGFHVEVLQRIALVEKIERFGSVADESLQFILGHADRLGLPQASEMIHQAAVGQFGNDHQIAVGDFDAFDRQQQRMPHIFDAREGPHFGLGVAGVSVAENDLDGLGNAAGGNRAPDLTVAAAAEQVFNPVSGNGFVAVEGVG